MGGKNERREKGWGGKRGVLVKKATSLGDLREAGVPLDWRPTAAFVGVLVLVRGAKIQPVPESRNVSKASP